MVSREEINKICTHGQFSATQTEGSSRVRAQDTMRNELYSSFRLVSGAVTQTTVKDDFPTIDDIVHNAY